MAAEDFLNGIENKQTLGDKIDASMISQASIPGFEQSIIDNTNQLSQPKEIGKQNFNDLYPGLSQNIQAGSYSGSEIGNVPIYVNGGNILALNPILERRKAQQEAATLRAQQLKPYTPPTPYQLKQIRYQNKLDDKFNSEVNKVIDDTYSKYGIEGNILLNNPSSPEYKKIAEIEKANNIFGKNFDEVTDMLVKVDEDSRSNSKLFPPEAHELSKQLQTMTGDVFGREGGFENIDKVNQVYDKLQGYQTLANYLEKSIEWKDFEGAVSSKFTFSGGDKYLSHKTNKVTNFDGIRKQVADEIEDGVRPQVEAGLITRDQIEKVVNSRLQNKQEVSNAGVSELRDDNKDTADFTQNTVTVTDPVKAPVTKILEYNQDGTVSDAPPTEYNEIHYSAMNGFKEVTLDSPRTVNGNNPQHRFAGNVKFTPTGASVITRKDSKGNRYYTSVFYGNAKVPTTMYQNKDGKFISQNEYESLSTKLKGPDGKMITNDVIDEKTQQPVKNSYSKVTVMRDQPLVVAADDTNVAQIQASTKKDIGGLVNSMEETKKTAISESKKTKGTNSGTGSKPAIQFDADGNIIE